MKALIARLLGWHVYRCMNCGHRFSDRASKA
jgi:DNA-directed RNA polymerase subunit RPC12/RpoP